MSGSRRRGRLVRRLALGVPVLLGIWACKDLIDPAQVPVEFELVGPDSVPLGDSVTVVASVVDQAGRRLTVPSLRWFLGPEDLFVHQVSDDRMELTLRATRAGEGSVGATLAESALRAEVSTLGMLVWSIAQGILLSSGSEGKVITIGTGQRLVLEAKALTVTGEPVSGGSYFVWRVLEDLAAGVPLWRVPEGPVRGGLAAYEAVALGDARVAVRHTLCAGSCADTVLVRVRQGMNLSVPDFSMHSLGDELELFAVLTDSSGGQSTDAPVEWMLADPVDEAVIELRGNVAVARSNGRAEIIATLGELSATGTVEVHQVISTVEVQGATQRDLSVGQRDTVVVRFLDANGHSVARSLALSARSDDASVVQVTVLDEGFELTGVGEGATLAWFAAEGQATYVEVLVGNAIEALEIRLGRDTLNFVGANTVAEAWGLSDGTWSQVSALFSTADTSVAVVGGLSGQVTSQGGGNTWIRAQAGGHLDSAQLTVRQVIAWLDVGPPVAMVALNGTVPFEAVAYDSAGFAIPSVEALWETSDPGVVSLDADGGATAVGFGSATVVATSGDHRDSAVASVIPAVASASLGPNHLCFTVEAGGLYCAGANAWGQLGDGTVEFRREPVRAASALEVSQVVVGEGSTCVITTDSRTYCWGAGDGGQLGNGAFESTTSPTQVQGDPGFVVLSGGLGHVCGLTQDGTAYCWGANFDGRAGVGHRDPVTVPTGVAGGHRFLTIHASETGTCAVADTGVIYCWGDQVTEPTATDTSQRFRDATTECGILEDGRLRCWKWFALDPDPSQRTYRAISRGWGFHCALGDDLQVYCFGSNHRGQLGTGDTSDRSSATRVLLDGPSPFVAAGREATCAGSAGGGLWCWGWFSELFSQWLPTAFVYP